MNLSKEAMEAIQKAIALASENNYEYVTPEMVLLMILDAPSFSEAYESCGGDIVALSKNLMSYVKKYIDKTSGREPELSIATQQMVNFAGQSAFSSGCSQIHIRHLIHAIWNLDNSYAVYYMEQDGLTEADLLQELSYIEDENNIEGGSATTGNPEKQEDTGNLKLFAPCLNETLEDVNPLIGRKEELERTIQILCRKDKNNPLHIGEPGVGKTAITYGLVELLRKDEVPDAIKGAKVYALDLGGMLAGTQYRGDFEKRFKKVLSEIGKEEKPIIYIDEIHNLSGAGAVGEGSFDASNMLKPYLADGHIRFIGATTYEEYKKYFEKNKSLVRRFQNVEIKEPTEDESIEILQGLKEKYEEYHGVKYDDEVLSYAVKMSAKYINERYLPDKAIDIIDEAGSFRKLHPTGKKVNTVDKEVINEILTKICRVPIETVETDDITGLSTLEDRLKGKIFGQDEAISQVVNAVKFSKAGLSEENKPLASLLFVGPTGVGKTEIARRLAEELGVKLVRFDMSEYGEKHAVAKLIGSPAGYVGYEEGGILTEAIRKHPSSVLLLDEIEKAHPDIFNVLLQVMDYATLTDNQGRKADFRNVVVIMTSNAGANRLGKSGIGFVSEGHDDSVLMEEVKRVFQPEFRNRLSKIVSFNSMDEQMAELVVEKKLSELKDQLTAKKISFSADKKARNLIKKRGISQEFGAREVDRVIRNDIKPLFVDEILFGKLKNGGKISLTVKDGEFVTTAGGKGK
ncbi:AAA family ATPase [Butyrivibrio sp. WCD3002]|uniref:AAA family ATPase n=1 Tax=Butyrivibrio sp. WCD3002 TaxID=1280676 RepID=UPI000419999D|nr:AAA family ATPase [Butyrivibrio sp. WCD3002]